MPETLFLLGREPALSVAELDAVAPGWNASVATMTADFALLRHADALPPDALARLGGSQKQCLVVDRWPLEQSMVATIARHATAAWVLEQIPSGRIEFGVSFYGPVGSDAQKHFLSLKKELKESGRPVRLVTSREPHLSAVTIQRNGLLKHGREFVFCLAGKEVIVAVTKDVQDYQAYGLRDFGRPAADPKSGMLPPKVAQMMLNFAQVKPEDVLLDPFCGTGTVLQEAILLGVGCVFGIDSSSKAVRDTQENIRWLLKEFPGRKVQAEITIGDARTSPVCPTVIVTEPYLGKPLRGHEPVGFLKTQIGELQHLYIDSFRRWRANLKPGGRVVMVWPEFITRGESMSLEIDDVIAGMGFSHQSLLHGNQAQLLGIRDPHVLSYGRPDAKVRRQIRMWRVA